MDTVILWAAFFGAWLLFVGPEYQAALELREQDLRGEDLERIKADLGEPPSVSFWWWLLPPVAFIKERRRNELARQHMLEHLDATTLAALLTYMNKATGWLLVGGGGFLLAARETWALVEHYDGWPWWLFFVVLAVMSAICVFFVAVRLRRGQQLLDDQERRRPSATGGGTAPVPTADRADAS